MVRKGSPVRVRQKALAKPPLALRDAGDPTWLAYMVFAALATALAG